METTKQQTAQAEEQRSPQMTTSDGRIVTHAHAFQSKDNPDAWYWTARIDGEQLKPHRMAAAEVEAYRTRTASVEQMMQRYFPSKIAAKVDMGEIPFVMNQGTGQHLTVEKFSVYKEKKTESPNFDKWMFFARIDGQNMSVRPAPALLSAYFDRTATYASLVTAAFGEKLHLAAAYEKYKLPAGAEPKSITISKAPGAKQYSVSADMGERGKTVAREISYDDGYSYFRAKTATREQLAAKYLGDEIKSMLAAAPSISAKEQSTIKR